ncbi:MAG: hypothetical protein AAFQ82_26100, partial [Myxococcota bacterium]
MTERDEDFFVGYLPMPSRLAKFSLVVAVVLMLLGVALAVLAARFQRTPGATLGPIDWNAELKG